VGLQDPARRLAVFAVPILCLTDAVEALHPQIDARGIVLTGIWGAVVRHLVAGRARIAAVAASAGKRCWPRVVAR